MLQISTEETYQDGDIIFKEGNAGDWIYLVISGAVEISKQIEGKKVVVDIIGPEGVFGELGFITQSPRSATATAVGETEIGIIDRDYLDQEFNKLSGDFRVILKSLAGRLKKTTEIALEAQMRRRDQRITKVLSLTFKSDAGLVKAFTEDMSIGGMFIRTAKPLPVGEVFTLKLTLPQTAQPIKIGCEVAWIRTEAKSDPPGMGVRFVQISEADQHRLKAELSKKR